jgi:hypothetical protein
MNRSNGRSNPTRGRRAPRHTLVPEQYRPMHALLVQAMVVVTGLGVAMLTVI